MDRLQSNHPIYDLDWWIEILTALPLCLYYFGSFTTRQEWSLRTFYITAVINFPSANLRFSCVYYEKI